MTILPAAVRVGDQLVASSGFVLLDASSVLSVDVAGLRFEFVFRDVDGSSDLNVESERINEKAQRIRLVNFKSPLGSTFGPVEVANVGGAKMNLALHVSAIGERLRAVSYCLLLNPTPPAV